MENIDILDLIKNTKGLAIKCPNCLETFDANKGKLFDIRKPYPKHVYTALNNQLSLITKDYKKFKKEKEAISVKIKDINKREKDLKKRKLDRPKLVQVITKRINIGQIVEKILPSTSKFKYETKDCRSLFNPVDYLSFNGLLKNSKVDSITFIEIKTGNAGLQKNQKIIEEIVKKGNIDLKVY